MDLRLHLISYFVILILFFQEIFCSGLFSVLCTRGCGELTMGWEIKSLSSTWQKGFSFAKYQFPFKAIKVKFVFLPHEKTPILITVEEWSIHTFKKRLLPFRMILHMKLKMKSTVKPQGHWHFKDMSIDVNCQCFCYGEALYFKYAEVSF